MKFTLRLTLTSILLTIVVLTVVALTVNSHRNNRFTADDLSAQILEQTSLRVDAQINGFLRLATQQGKLNQQLLQSGQYSTDDYPRLAPYWVEVMKVHPRLTRLSLGLEDTGEWFYVRRNLDGRVAIGELRSNRLTHKLELRDYWPEDYAARKPFYFDADKSDEDPRLRPWYIAARQAQRQIWSETYVFFGTQGFADVPGVSCATPIFEKDGSLRGVLTSSFDLVQLSTFLKDLRVGANGYAFVLEFRADGERRVIAHPDPGILLRPIVNRGQEHRELVPPDEFSDQRVATFLRHPLTPLRPTDLEGTTQLHFSHDGVRYLGSFHNLTSTETPDWLICVILPEDDVLARVERSHQQTMWIVAGILLAATLVSLYVSRRVAEPLNRLVRETEGIGRLQLQPQPVAHSMVFEVDRLAVAVEETKTSLRSFRKYVPAELVSRLLSSGEEAALGGEERRLTIYFCDLANFTAVSEKLTPEALVRHLSDYFGTFSAEILASGGTVDKYIGDAIMAFWGAPAAMPDHARAACHAALRNQAALKELRQRWQAESRPLLHARIGLHTGDVVVGNIGSPARLNYTVMGDAVNLASRLEGLNKYYGTEILISEQTYREAEATVLARPVDWVSVKGKTEAVLIYELLGVKGDGVRELEEVANLSTQALARYRGRDWAGAIGVFEQVLSLRSDDGPAQLLRTRCRAYQTQPPPAEWDGVHHMTEK